MTDKKLKVGLIGCGRFAEPGHAVYYKVNPRCEFAAVCDSNIDAAKALARKYGVPRAFDNAPRSLMPRSSRPRRPEASTSSAKNRSPPP
jgi:predicted dehydrogenase